MNRREPVWPVRVHDPAPRRVRLPPAQRTLRRSTLNVSRPVNKEYTLEPVRQWLDE